MTTETTTKTASEIRREFLEFFAGKHGHEIVPSAPVVPHDDPTLLFTNAGMNQFKDVFLGRGDRPYTRAVDTQKCIRAGGKHNDLEDVGKDTYHHTFFEMLGNWSFGDYFKEEAIAWAWDLLTNQWGLDPERLYVTVFAGDAEDGLEPDTEAEEIWKKHVDPARIQRYGKKDNFWEMGDTGPCGPCSEIHYDCTPEKDGAGLVNADDPRVIEVWNLVFIQFNRGSDGVLEPLPAKHVDTGMGLERIVRVLQGKDSNYDPDLFTPIFDAIQRETGARPYQGAMDDAIDVAYRVIADHVRCLTVAITDGAQPGNEGRGYVLRRILRRAVRHARQTLGVDSPVLHALVPSVVDTLGEAFPELADASERVIEVIRREEEAFFKTLDRGLELFEEAVQRASQPSPPGRGQGEGKNGCQAPSPQPLSRGERGSMISAEDAFKLHDTYGFPIDLTRVMAEERGMTVDEAGFEKLMAEARERSRGQEEGEEELLLPPGALARLRAMEIPATEDIDKYHARPVSTEVRAIWNGSDFDNVAHMGGRYAVITERTSCYAEAGGQVGDRGFVRSAQDTGQIGGWGAETSVGRAAGQFDIEDTRRVGEYILHIGRVRQGKIRVGDRVMVDVEDRFRNPTKAHHTATHLLNHALRQVLDDEVEQKGSLVAPDRLRFDYSTTRSPGRKELNAIERLVNAAIHQNLPVHAMDVPLEQAKKINGVRAVFGEKYPDPVRVVSIGPSIDRLLANPDLPRWRECSIEFCGGTHVNDTGEARRFVIVSEQALAAGVRRIVAMTGPAAMAADGAGKELESRCFRAKSLSGEELVEEVDDISRQLESLTVGLVQRQKIQEQLEALRERGKAVRKESQAAARENAVDQARVLAENIQGRIIVDQLAGGDQETLLSAIDVLKSRRPDAAAMLLSADEDAGKVVIVARVPQELIDQGLKAGDWVREAAKVVGGGGGGRPDMAQAGGKDPGKIDDAIRRAKDVAEESLA